MRELHVAIAVMRQLLRWFEAYDGNHPHKGLKRMLPREYIKLVDGADECSVQYG